jgi:uncharacterized Zn finger protein
MKPELSEKMLAAAAGWPVVHAARKIRDTGKVSRVSYEHPILKGAVRSGSRTYGAGLRLGGPIENLCGCYESWSEGTICAHSVAVALVLLTGKPDAAESGPTGASAAVPPSEE